MRKIWICGASGMLGSHVERLCKERQELYIANDFKEIDITQVDVVSDFVREEKITHIINCAAYTQVDKAEEELEKAYRINALGPHHLGIAGRRHRARVVHFSTDYVFDGNSRKPYDEASFCAPIGAYGLSKFAGEMKLMEEHIDACIIRTSWLFGHPGKNFVQTMLQLMEQKNQLSVVADQFGRPTYCEDLAEVALELLDEEGIFHFANSGETSWHLFAKEIYDQALIKGFPLKECKIDPVSTSHYPTVAKRPAYSVLNTKKIEDFLQHKPRHWKEALTDYLAVYQQSMDLALSGSQHV